jgi:3-oxoacyl-[acyl-carrier protein] reductase
MQVAEALAGDRTMAIEGDVAAEEFGPQCVADAVARFGAVHGLVNCAGITRPAMIEKMTLRQWQEVINVNLTACHLMQQAVGKHMIERARAGEERPGAIVNISSIMGFVSSAEGHPGYSASKGAVRLLTKNAAVRWGPQGVRVNSVHPGYLPPMLGGTNGPGRSAKIPLTPLRRLGEPIEVAYGVLFLASDEASFITGTELVIDGGFIAQ